jgi:hypothetical protein
MNLMRMKPATAVAALALASFTFAALPADTAAARSATLSGAQGVVVNVNFQTQLPIDDLSDEAIVKSQESARALLYKLANKECGLLTATIAKTCRLSGLSINVNMQNRNNQSSTYLYVKSNARYTITLKDAPAKQ